MHRSGDDECMISTWGYFRQVIYRSVDNLLRLPISAQIILFTIHVWMRNCWKSCTSTLYTPYSHLCLCLFYLFYIHYPLPSLHSLPLPSLPSLLLTFSLLSHTLQVQTNFIAGNHNFNLRLNLIKSNECSLLVSHLQLDLYS